MEAHFAAVSSLRYCKIFLTIQFPVYVIDRCNVKTRNSSYNTVVRVSVERKQKGILDYENKERNG